MGSEAPASVEPKRSMRANISLILPILAKYRDSSILRINTPFNSKQNNSNNREEATVSQAYDAMTLLWKRYLYGFGLREL